MHFVPSEYQIAEDLILSTVRSAPAGTPALAAGEQVNTKAPSLECIGHFHRGLHLSAPPLEADTAQLQGRFANTAVQAVRSKLMFAAAKDHILPHALLLWPRSLAAAVPSALEMAAAAGRQLAEHPGICLTHGDSWMRSFMLATGTTETTERPPGFAIDWEFVHWGQPLQDWAHVYAHVWMLTHGGEEGATAAPWTSQHMLHTDIGATLWSSYCSGYLRDTEMVSGGKGGATAPAASGEGSFSQATGPAQGTTGVEHDGSLLDTAQLAGAWVACELLTRAGGPFGAGFVYQPETPDERTQTRANEACVCAVALLMSAQHHGRAAQWTAEQMLEGGQLEQWGGPFAQLQYADAVYSQLQECCVRERRNQ